MFFDIVFAWTSHYLADSPEQFTCTTLHIVLNITDSITGGLYICVWRCFCLNHPLLAGSPDQFTCTTVHNVLNIDLIIDSVKVFIYLHFTAANFLNTRLAPKDTVRWLLLYHSCTHDTHLNQELTWHHTFDFPLWILVSTLRGNLSFTLTPTSRACLRCSSQTVRQPAERRLRREKVGQQSCSKPDIGLRRQRCHHLQIMSKNTHRNLQCHQGWALHAMDLPELRKFG